MNSSQITSQLYTPAMMAEMLCVSVRAVRLWYRAGLLQPTQTVMKIPYFDYAALTTAKTFSQWVDQGLTAQSIVRQVTALCELSGISAAEGAGLSISLQGKRLVLSQGSLHLEANGQLQLGFDSQDTEECTEPITLKFLGNTNDIGAKLGSKQEFGSLAEMVENAIIAEENDDLDAAIQWYRTALAAFGSNADVCFQLAEVLYRSADLSAARERYYCAIELDPELVEARANLGCVLAECGQLDLAVAAFQGALSQYPDYADVHFHLARTLDDAGRASEALVHWQRFVELAPASPWADEAQSRLGVQPSLNFQE
ncbi:MAG: tetratricopeptide repeat protein [Pirellulales bacterium]